jgi:hypothetical protein
MKLIAVSDSMDTFISVSPFNDKTIQHVVDLILERISEEPLEDDDTLLLFEDGAKVNFNNNSELRKFITNKFKNCVDLYDDGSYYVKFLDFNENDDWQGWNVQG